MTHKPNIEFTGIKLGHSHKHKENPWTTGEDALKVAKDISEAFRRNPEGWQEPDKSSWLKIEEPINISNWDLLEMLKKNAEKQFESELRFIQKSLVLSDKLEELENFLIGKKGRSKTGKPDSDYSEITSVSITDKDIIIKFKSGYFTGLTYLELE